MAIPRAFGITAKEATKALAGIATALKDYKRQADAFDSAFKGPSYSIDTGSLRSLMVGTSNTLTFTSGSATSSDITYGGEYFQTTGQKEEKPTRPEARRWLDERVEEVRGLAWE